MKCAIWFCSEIDINSFTLYLCDMSGSVNDCITYKFIKFHAVLSCFKNICMSSECTSKSGGNFCGLLPRNFVQDDLLETGVNSVRREGACLGVDANFLTKSYELKKLFLNTSLVRGNLTLQRKLGIKLKNVTRQLQHIPQHSDKNKKISINGAHDK